MDLGEPMQRKKDQCAEGKEQADEGECVRFDPVHLFMREEAAVLQPFDEHKV
ncbi:MAG: Uncharacterised protein [Flavobacteriia bacterium]|nr:MAG: Uncharacterised protein [Flavobacteriia bacterium]